MNIWIFHHYGSPPTMSGLTRPYHFAKFLRERGYKSTVFSSAYLHYSNENLIKNKAQYLIHQEDKIPFVFIKTAEYKKNKLSRIFNMYSFYRNLFPVTKSYEKENGKPDVILASSAHPLTVIAGIKIAKKYKIPCICEIRDLWPESIFEYGSLRKNSFFGKLLQAGEKWIYKKVDKIIFTMQGGYDYIIEQGWQNVIPKEKCFYINNGVDLEAFDYNRKNYKIEDEDLDNDSIFKVVYTGSVRRVNNLRIIADTAKELRENSNIKFLIWGGGNELEELRSYVESEGLTNIVFKGHVEKKYIPYILSKSDLNLIHCKQTNIMRFGSSENKTFDYLASGKPILRTIKTGYDIILESNSGKCLEEQTVENIKGMVLDFYNIFTEQRNIYDEMCHNARRTADKYDFKVLTDKLIEVIEL
ncbi:MAG: glycosyltransferase family 4 protein [Oscillospiraceae bacterium]|nr:glycosyltransferase family 4 protein [Oscillospiraceae bacterium]